MISLRFATPLQVLITSSIIFIVLLVFRLITGKHLSPAWKVAIWLVLLLRLSLPFTIETGWHPLKAPAPYSTLLSIAEPQQQEQVPVSPELSLIEPLQPLTIPDRQAFGAVTEKKQEVSFHWQVLLPVVWGIGTVLVLGRSVIKTIRLRQHLTSHRFLPKAELVSAYQTIAEQEEIRHIPPLYLVDDLSGPALVAGFHPMVLLPAKIAQNNDTAFRYAIRHELMHYKRLDHLMLVWIIILQSIWWFHPVTWLMEALLRTDLEAACDASVTQKMNATERLQYASFLLQWEGE